MEGREKGSERKETGKKQGRGVAGKGDREERVMGRGLPSLYLTSGYEPASYLMISGTRGTINIINRNLTLTRQQMSGTECICLCGSEMKNVVLTAKWSATLRATGTVPSTALVTLE